MPWTNFQEGPAAGQGAETVSNITALDIGDIIRNARAAQVLWAALPYGERAGKLRKARRRLCTHIDEIVETIHRENGKLRIDALAAEVLPAIMGIDYYIRRGRSFLKGRRLAGASPLMFNKRCRLEYRSWGVVGIISPWNYPFAIPFSEIVMALLAGNAVIFKAAGASTAVGRMLAELFAAAELPAGLFTQVELPGAQAGPAFITGVDKLFFTGSTAVGRELMALAAPRLLPLVLELGGADAAIVRADADLDRAAAGILWAGYSNAGQSCGGVQRILVHRAVYTAFLEKLGALVSALRPGWGEDAGLGPMTSLEQKERTEAQVARCLALGARVAAQSPDYDAGGAGAGGSGALNPFADRFTRAVLLCDVKPGMPVLEEEIFGPVTAVIPVEDDEEALRLANDSPYGLTASVWSTDRRAASRLASRLNAGAVMLNDHLMSHGLAESPWGGFGDSGLGKTHGEPGFREMLNVKVIVDDILPGVKRNLWWQPYSEGVYRGIRSIAAFLAGPGLGSRLKAMPGVLKIFFRYWQR
ncbi:MAG: aldehyde dehydrogenase family protein [Treponema sp.]|jgi:succinate-semialdehyde dehydrogenase/glutarate-semialdehyde dehydrogenase|nr:aldehyde dehydrogenase family protein [Treponema sp.]